MAANAGGIRAGRAYVEVGSNNNPLFRGLKAAEARLKAFGASVRAVGAEFARVGAGLATLGTTASAPLAFAVKAAGDAAEQASKLNAIFKDSSPEIEKWADGFADAVGRGRGETKKFVGDVGALLSGFGFAAGDIAELSKAVTSLGVDLGSFFNTSDAEAIQSIMSGLVGESEPLKKFGVLVQEAQTDAELLSKGLDPDAATDQQKVLARLNVVLKGTVAAQGDAIRTADSFNNQMKRAQGTLADLAVEAGNALLPAVTELTTQLNAMLSPLLEWLRANPELVKTIGTMVVVTVAAGAAIAAVGVAIVGVGAVIGGLGTILGALASPIGLVVAGLAGLAVWFLAATDAGGKSLSWLGDRFGELKDTASAAFEGMGNALKAGDLALAGEILWATLKLQWLKGTAFLQSTLGEWVAAAKVVFEGLSFDIARVMIDLWAGVRRAFASFAVDMQSSWGSLVERLIKTFIPLADVIAEVLGVDIQKAIDNALGGDGEAAAAKREKMLAEANAGIEADRQGAQAALNDQQEAATAARWADFRKGVADGEAEVAKAAAELEGLLGKAGVGAAGAAAAKAAKGGPAAAVLPGLTPEGLDAGLKGARADVKGTFNAAAIRGLGADSVQDKILEENKKHNQALKKLVKNTDQLGLAT